MNRYLTFSLAIAMTLSTLAILLRAATKPRAGKTEGATVVWMELDALEDLARHNGIPPGTLRGQ